jgi:hypothetical protein
MARRCQSDVIIMNSRLLLTGNGLKICWSTVCQQEVVVELRQCGIIL